MDIHKRNNVRTFGFGNKPIIFAHGFGCDQTMWRYITPAFEFGYKVILFDYVGSGRSDLSSYGPDRYSSLDGYAEDILEICKSMKLKDVILVGHSISGIIAMIAALKEPTLFADIIMIGSNACYINKDTGYNGGFEQEEVDALLSSMEESGTAWAKPLGRKVIGKLGKPEHADELTLSFSDMAPGVARQFAEVTFFADFRHRVASLKVPTLIIQSANDPVVPLSAAEYLHKAISGSTLKIIDATGHYPLLSAPDEIIDNIKEYLEADLDLT